MDSLTKKDQRDRSKIHMREAHRERGAGSVHILDIEPMCGVMPRMNRPRSRNETRSADVLPNGSLVPRHHRFRAAARSGRDVAVRRDRRREYSCCRECPARADHPDGENEAPPGRGKRHAPLICPTGAECAL